MGRWSTYSRRGLTAAPSVNVPPLLLYGTPTVGPTYQNTTPPDVYQARRFRPATSGLLLAFRLLIRRTGNPSGNVSFQLFEDGDLVPGALTAQWSGPLASSLPLVADFVTFQAPGIPVASQARRWLSIGLPSATASDYVSAGLISPFDSMSRRQAQSADGVVWANVPATRSWITSMWGVAP